MNGFVFGVPVGTGPDYSGTHRATGLEPVCGISVPDRASTHANSHNSLQVPGDGVPPSVDENTSPELRQDDWGRAFLDSEGPVASMAKGGVADADLTPHLEAVVTAAVAPYRQEMERLQSVAASQAETIGVLKARLAVIEDHEHLYQEMVTKLKQSTDDVQRQRLEVERLRAELAAARLRLLSAEHRLRQVRKPREKEIGDSQPRHEPPTSVGPNGETRPLGQPRSLRWFWPFRQQS